MESDSKNQQQFLPLGTRRRTAAAATSPTPVQSISNGRSSTMYVYTHARYIIPGTSYNSIIPGISGPTVEVLGCETIRL